MLLSFTCILKNHFSAKFLVGCKAGLGFLRSLPMEFPSRKTFFRLQPKCSLSKRFLLPEPISPLGAASASLADPPGSGREGAAPLPLALKTAAPLGFPGPVPAQTFTALCHGDHTQWQRFLPCLLKGQGFKGIPWVLQNAGYSPFHSVSPIEPGSPGSGHLQQLSLTTWLGVLGLPHSHSQAWPDSPLIHPPPKFSF